MRNNRSFKKLYFREEKPSKKLALKFARSVNSAYLCTAFGKGDSLAQLVEHIPFKDGVLGSSPRRITWYKQHEMKIHTFLSVYLFYFQRFGLVFLAATDCFALRHRLIACCCVEHVNRQFVQKKVKALNMIASMNGRMLSAPDAVIL